MRKRLEMILYVILFDGILCANHIPFFVCAKLGNNYSQDPQLEGACTKQIMQQQHRQPST